MVSSLNSENIPNNIVLYDGYCVLCSRSIDFILSRDSLATFQFASLQSDFAQSILPEMGYTVVNIQNLSNTVYQRVKEIKIKTDAFQTVMWDLGGIYKVSRLAYCLPRVVRDFGYDRLAKLRYRIFGKRNSCRVPTLQEKTRFLR